MRVGAIITVAAEDQGRGTTNDETPSQSLFSLGISPVVCQELLGQTLLQRTRQSLRESGVEQQTVLFEHSGSQSLITSGSSTAESFSSAWETAVGQQLNDGEEVLLLIRLGPYLEIDFHDLLRFHRETCSGLTQVYGKNGAFDLGVINASQLRSDSGSYRRRLSALIPQSRRYNFSGYSNRLREPGHLRRLVHDALTGRNAIRPAGEQAGPGIWIGEGASVDPGANLCGPVYIGANTQIKGSCIINGGTAIERDCEVDFGTTVTDSCVLPGTYVGMGLNIVHSIVAPNRLFHLDRNVGMDISDAQLIGSRLPSSILAGFTKSISKKGSLRRVSNNLFGSLSHL
jgi:hypothetical protein